MKSDEDLMLTVVPPPGRGVKTGVGTKFFLSDGSELKEVTRCVLTFGVNEILRATIDLAIDQIESIEAHPLLSLEMVKWSAREYGFELVKTVDGAGDGT